jgi:hypothetical protein
MLYFQFGLYQDITVGLQNCKVLVVCVSDEVSGSKHMYEYNRIGGVLVSSAVDRGFERRSGQTKDYEIGICCFSTRHAALRRKRKDWLARNQDNVSGWDNLSIHGLLFQ